MTSQDYKACWTSQDEAGVFIGKAIATINSELGTINNETQNLIGTWDPSASKTEYETRQQTWTTAANDIVRVLEAFKKCMHDIAGVSSDTETAAARRMAT